MIVDGLLGGQTMDLNMWVIREGIRGASAAELFDGLCERLVIAGVPVWRAFIGMPTLHPQLGGYSYTWRRDLTDIEPAHFGRGDGYQQIIENSPFGYLIRRVEDEEIRGSICVGASLDLRRSLISLFSRN